MVDFLWNALQVESKSAITKKEQHRRNFAPTPNFASYP